MVILAVLLVLEVVADKVPVVDSVDDVMQTVVQPAAGGIALALVVHAAKASARSIINATTLGAGGPMASTAEDATSVGLSFAAILAPVLVALALAALVVVWFQTRERVRTARRTGSLRMRGRPQYGSVGPDDADPVSSDRP